MTDDQELRLKCMEIAMKASVACEFSFKSSVIADDIYEWVTRSKPEESKPKES